MISKLKKVFQKKFFKKSYSQCGEDMIIDFLFYSLKVSCPSYLDIGSNHPMKLSNTYYFYKYKRSKGVLIEPNPELARIIKKKRPNDSVYNCGIGTNSLVKNADYFIMDWHEFNTFSEEVAIETQKKYDGRNNIIGKVKIELIDINSVLEKHFDKGLDILSIDVEGLDLEILKSMNFNKYKPKIICTEIMVASSSLENETSEFLFSKGYKLVATTPINGIYLDSNIKI